MVWNVYFLQNLYLYTSKCCVWGSPEELKQPQALTHLSWKELFPFYLLNSWVAVLFGNSSPVFHYISWTNPSNVLNVSWYFEWFFCQPSTALQLFWSICKVTHMTDVAPAIGCLCLSDWRTPTHPRLLLAIEKDLCQWLHMSFSGEIYNHINILISFWMSLLRERWSSQKCAALSSAHKRLRVLQKRKIGRLCHWGSKPCSCSTKRCINAPCWVSNDSSKSEHVWYPIVVFWYAKCQGNVSRSLSRKCLPASSYVFWYYLTKSCS